MKNKPKKSQVDIALTVGAIIIPVAALFGALIFAFLMISQFGDAARLAYVISHDSITLADVAYSVPDSVNIYYHPPSVCEFVNTSPGGPKDMISCFNGYMNLSQFQFKTASFSSQIKSGCTQIPFNFETHFSAKLPDSVRALAYEIEYPGYANMNDPSMMKGNDFRISLDVNDSIIVRKTRTSTYDTLDPFSTALHDPLYYAVDNMLDACRNGRNIMLLAGNLNPAIKRSDTIFMSYSYNLNRSVGSPIISLTRFNQNPIDIMSNDAAYMSQSILYSVNVSKLNPSCTFNINNTFNDTTINYTKPAGNNFKVETNIGCYEDCNTGNISCQCWNMTSSSQCINDNQWTGTYPGDYCRYKYSMGKLAKIYILTTNVTIKESTK